MTVALTLFFVSFCEPVTDCVWCTANLALIQQLQGDLPTPAFSAGADGGIVTTDDLES